MRVQVAWDGADDRVDSVFREHFFPGAVGRARRAFLAGVLDGDKPMFQVLGVDVADGADGDARDLQEVFEQGRASVPHADQADP